MQRAMQPPIPQITTIYIPFSIPFKTSHMSSLSQITSALAESLCGGSSRKLVAGWWYVARTKHIVRKCLVRLSDSFHFPLSLSLRYMSRYAILLLCFALFLLTFWTLSTRTGAESFCSFWSATLILLLCVGGTMVMRKFHNRTATGVFLGALVGAAQFFFLLFLM